MTNGNSHGASHDDDGYDDDDGHGEWDQKPIFDLRQFQGTCHILINETMRQMLVNFLNEIDISDTDEKPIVAFKQALRFPQQTQKRQRNVGPSEGGYPRRRQQ